MVFYFITVLTTLVMHKNQRQTHSTTIISQFSSNAQHPRSGSSIRPFILLVCLASSPTDYRTKLSVMPARNY